MAIVILGISGSLRSSSTNSSVLRAAAELAPADVEIRIWDGPGSLPHFNPDLDTEPANAEVARFRAALREAGAVLISSPEYAHGVPGALKNALDWVVGSGEFVDKPVALINASPYATMAQASLAETLRTMSAKIVPEAFITLPIASGKPNASQMLASPEIAAALQSAMAALVSQARKATFRSAAR
jgi:NAD(P)H-dependent FMN reductase